MGQRAAIYARVSTADQSCERQLRDLAGFAERGGYEVVEVFRETASGMKANRSARAEVMKLAQARHIDAILVTELSRWGRSTQDLLDTLNRLSGWRVSVVAMIRMVSDDPAKGMGKATGDRLLAAALHKAIGEPKRELRLVSGYFVPTQAGVDGFGALARRGVDVAIFTNAFEASDVWVVHAGYAERRKAMLRAGIRLFEMRGPDRSEGARPRRKLIGAGSGSGSGSGSGTGGAGAAVQRDDASCQDLRGRP